VHGRRNFEQHLGRELCYGKNAGRKRFHQRCARGRLHAFSPVLMTALAMIIGMVPMALGLGMAGTKRASGAGGHRRAPFRHGSTCSLSGIFQPSAGFAPASSSTGIPALSKNLSGVIMSQQTEEKKQVGGQTLRSNDVRRRPRPHRGWLGLAITLIAVAALLGSGIWSVSEPHSAEGGNGASRPHRRVGRFAKTDCARRGDHPSWKRAAIYYLTDLRTHEWIFKEVVRRYWSAR